jgi:hypothetical protein
MSFLFKQIKMRVDRWNILKNYADSLAQERGGKPGDISLPKYIFEAATFFEDSRRKGKK